MALNVYVAKPVAANTPFRFVVPGQYNWRVLSIIATLARAVGGVPNRTLQLSITDQTNTVIVSPANDAGTEPGTLTVTWAKATPASVATGNVGVSLGPLPVAFVPAAYQIIGTVINGVAADQWTRAVAWVDETPT